MNAGNACRGTAGDRVKMAGTCGSCALALLLVLLLAAQPAAAIVMPEDPDAPRPSAPQKTNRETMKEYGASLAKDHPELAAKSNLEKGRFAFAKYCEALAAAGAPVNANAWNRIQNAVRSGESGRWTCSDHTLNLQALFEGVGISAADTLNIRADSESLIPTPNSDHGGLVLFDDDGGAYIFDAWKFAVDNDGAYTGTFTPAASKWNGMEAAQWGVEMRTYPCSYTRFTCDAGLTWDPHAADAIERYKGHRPVKTPAPVTAGHGTGGHPVITRFSGPDATTISSVVKHDFSQVSFTYRLEVAGGSPPYTYTWMGDGYRVLYEGTQYATVTIPTRDLRFNGEGFAVYLTVKDAAGEYAVGKDPNSGVMTRNLAYYIDAANGAVRKLPEV